MSVESIEGKCQKEPEIEILSGNPVKNFPTQ